tara:strand:+ start:86 stop:460 length:375 start_codon:yes stop_codon:yes gene_type:complete
MIKISTRIVFLTKDRAYKFPISRRGYLQGKQESYIWNKYKDTKFFAPLIWECLGIVCQERVSTIDKISDTRLEQIRNTISELKIENCDLHNVENWGLYNNKQVLLDYGINERISNMYKSKKDAR